MARKRFTPEQIIQHLRTVELEQGGRGDFKRVQNCRSGMVQWARPKVVILGPASQFST